MTVRSPRLLDASGQEVARLHPARLSFDLRLTPLSTAEMVIPADDPAVPVRSFLELYDEGGSQGVYRVTAVKEEPGLTRRLYLEHALATLSDGVIPATGFTGTAREAFGHLLSHQPDPRWQLGDVDLPDDLTVVFTCPTTNLLTAVMDLLALLPDGLAFHYDQQALPWTLHIRQLTDEDACEGRLTRNLSSVTVLTDAEGLCTRVYPFGAGQGSDRITLTPLTGQSYLDSPAADAWGRICRTFTAQTVFDVPTLLAVAEKYLERHSRPTVSITATGADLAAMTGESTDSFRIGRMCRLALPERGVTLRERVVALRKPDVITRPGQMTATLSDRIHDTADEIADMIREVTASRVIGGRVTDVTTTSYFEGSSASAVEHYFRVEDWAAILHCRVTLEPSSGVSVVRVTVDNNPVPANVWAGGAFDALPYLRRDDLGVVTTGRHTLAIFPDQGGVGSTVTMKVIEKI